MLSSTGQHFLANLQCKKRNERNKCTDFKKKLNFYQNMPLTLRKLQAIPNVTARNAL